MATGDRPIETVRFCACVGYLYNGGRCCMDGPQLPQGKTVTSDKIIIGQIDPPVIAQGWECPRCHLINAPHAERCSCQPRAQVTDGNTTMPMWGTFTEGIGVDHA